MINLFASNEIIMVQENCWAMTSVILEMLETEGRGSYAQGKLCYPEWAPEVRERVRNTLRATSRTSMQSFRSSIHPFDLVVTVAARDVTALGSDAKDQPSIPRTAELS